MENKKRIDGRKNNKGHKGLCGRPKKFNIGFGKTKRISVSIPSLKENEIREDFNTILNKYM